ncbi:MAG: hypothetical protein A2X94_16790 [Bdellovibrionales bacterium GWB1_55_8]|nr:MAG: hypothetical protein A2X94_16790 [Bdellovibrionales bacterium GWB1_55_8]
MASGSELLPQVAKFVIPAVAVVAIVTDLVRGRIFNWLTLPTLLLGVVAAIYWGGWTAVGQSALGIGLGLLLYGWMFWLGAMGGGDVKFLMALGAWGGPRYVTEVAILAVLLGGAIGLVVMIFTGRIRGFSVRMYRFLLTLFIKDLVLEMPKVDRGFTMPFGVPIAIAAVWGLFAAPLKGWFLWN